MSMKVELREVSKRFRQDWVLWKVDLQLSPGQSLAVTGPNGSGKSTLLKILCGHLSPSRGQRSFERDGQPVDIARVYREVSFAAPYIDLIEEFTLREAIDFHQKLKPLRNGLDTRQLIDLLGFAAHRNKAIRFFSSGMRQRLKLALACCSDSSLLLLDEPTTNLDEAGARWFHQLLKEFGEDRTLVIASNVEADLAGCRQRLSVLDFKRRKRS